MLSGFRNHFQRINAALHTYDGEDIVRMRSGNTIRWTTSHFVHGPGIDEPIERVDVVSQLRPPPGPPIPTYYHADGLGSIIATTDASGAVTSTVRYDAWGNIEAGGVAYAFTGREFDGGFDTPGLYYYRARYYDPKIGRFVSEDPIRFGGGVNFYAYVENNPVNHVDPEGLIWVPPPGTLSRVRDFWSGLYQDFHQRRSQGQQQFPGDPNSYMRHCVTSCLAARDYGNTWVPRLFGMANEAQGFLWWDIRRLRSRITGQTAWAFQFDDLASNEVGFACGGRTCESCEECCGNIGPFGR